MEAATQAPSTGRNSRFLRLRAMLRKNMTKLHRLSTIYPILFVSGLAVKAVPSGNHRNCIRSSDLHGKQSCAMCTASTSRPFRPCRGKKNLRSKQWRIIVEQPTSDGQPGSETRLLPHLTQLRFVSMANATQCGKFLGIRHTPRCRPNKAPDNSRDYIHLELLDTLLKP